MMPSKSFVFHFDDVEVREREFTLTKAGKLLTVEPKAFRTLLFLLHNPQRLIAKEELLNTVWGDAAVTEGSLTRCIWLLRTVLGDDIHQPRYIKTVATVGYRFVCKVEVSQDASGNLEADGEPDRLPPVADKAPEKDPNLLQQSDAAVVRPDLQPRQRDTQSPGVAAVRRKASIASRFPRWAVILSAAIFAVGFAAAAGYSMPARYVRCAIPIASF
jgi:DNA-binding winged helix-turn-helix (wHTH) protein